jgi:hypothetical protein
MTPDHIPECVSVRVKIGASGVGLMASSDMAAVKAVLRFVRFV